MGNYDDIINMPRHTSPLRPRMSKKERAAQFSPFAALTGYESAIAETGRVTDARVDLDENERARLDEKLRFAAAQIKTRPVIKITYFLADSRKSGGAYVDYTGALKRIDTVERTVIFEDKTSVPVDDIYEIEFAEKDDEI